MTPLKLVAIALAAVLGGAGSLLLLGGAQAVSWHDYQGELYAGHAYGLSVPAGAKAIEFAYEGPADGLATLTVYSPAGAKVAFYKLDANLNDARIADPQPGRYVAFVHELRGALHLRVGADRVDSLDLQKVPIAREDVEIASADQPAPLSKGVVTTFRAEPAFVTLLYTGSVQSLDATIASPSGAVAEVRGETGSASSPGVWTDQSGTRVAHPENVSGTTYTTTMKATSFEGTLVLSALSLQLGAPEPSQTSTSPPTQPSPPSRPHDQPPGPSPAPVGPRPTNGNGTDSTPVSFPLARMGAVAFTIAHADDLVLSAPHGCGCGDQVSIYAPDDTLLAAVTIGASNVTVRLPAAGEYVAFVLGSSSPQDLRASLVNETATNVRTLALEARDVAMQVDPLSLDRTATFVLSMAPNAFRIRLDDGTVGAFTSIDVRSDKGVAASYSAPASVGGLDAFGGLTQNPKAFVAGTYHVASSGLMLGMVHVTSLHYLRSAPTASVTMADPSHP